MIDFGDAIENAYNAWHLGYYVKRGWLGTLFAWALDLP